MALTLTRVLDPAFAGFDNIIDVRAPAEYAEDHLPGAINLPVLSDDERAQVGTIYKQVSPFDARKIGGAMVAANAARHIAGPLADRDGSWRALIYCWRGGQRSGSFETILAQIGWRVDRVEGGYKSWRKLVVARVQDHPMPAPVVVLDGNTGSGKTAILGRLAARGVQIIDLEGLANHRGSLFGAMPGGQPGQKMFESRLALAIEALDPSRPVVVEAESSRIGNLNIPKSVWQSICAAPRIRLDIPVEARARFTADSYRDMSADPDQIAAILSAMSGLHPSERILTWQQQAAEGQWTRLAHGLLNDHYDPRYHRHRARHDDGRGHVVALSDLTDLDLAAARVEAALAHLHPAGRG
ncbi:tRNA 2-selenouridine(34) synthase MnmH [Paracoccus fistulariae]|uniref:tRNA 2-selenouridine(34) synthase MnmH n=1 Tax=Paracoccus fistulariae TaxID=658446 RepID=A0ABY7SNX1_9RHOB|nr:tRNA 2-selenouridine(34) synthase MnmH [Paracoccus fistulariae]MDB6182330.1 tRNA 2-selenouridine(34) synthase MnmH [Paracoccus fistulariae]WCR08690.1 tRNA 2-selenouridine(34) synthase MnmH [Paracoccus fistulariae]